MVPIARVLVVLGALCGAAGVAAAAAGSHLDSRNLDAIALICLSHGPALLALGLYGKGRGLLWGGLALAFGTAIFGGDLMVREAFERALFPGAAPLGGGIMIASWFALAFWALVERGGKLN